MGSVGPWAICVGVFVVMPLVSFALGYKIGRGDFPLRVNVEWAGGENEEYREYG